MTSYKEIDTSAARRVDFADDEQKKVIEVTLDEAIADTEEVPTLETPIVQPKEDRKNQPPSRAQKRIKQLVSERDEAYALADRERQEKEELRKQLSTGNKQTKEALKSTLESQVQTLQKQMIDAIKNGEAELTVEIQDSLFEAKSKLKDLGNIPTEVESKPIESSRQPQNTIPERAVEWIEEHPEFTTDEKFHRAALGVNNLLIAEGYDANDEDFYEELNNRLSKRFPDVFGIQKENGVELNQTSDSSNKGKSDVKVEAPKVQQTVSGSSRATSASTVTSKKSQRVELSQADIAQADRWGLTMEQMARRILHAEQNKRGDGYVPIMIKKDTQ